MLWPCAEGLTVVGADDEPAPVQHSVYGDTSMTQKKESYQQIIAELQQALSENPEVTLEGSLLDLAVVAMELQNPHQRKDCE